MRDRSASLPLASAVASPACLASGAALSAAMAVSSAARPRTRGRSGWPARPGRRRPRGATRGRRPPRPTVSGGAGRRAGRARCRLVAGLSAGVGSCRFGHRPPPRAGVRIVARTGPHGIGSLRPRRIIDADGWSRIVEEPAWRSGMDLRGSRAGPARARRRGRADPRHGRRAGLQAERLRHGRSEPIARRAATGRTSNRPARVPPGPRADGRRRARRVSSRGRLTDAQSSDSGIDVDRPWRARRRRPSSADRIGAAQDDVEAPAVGAPGDVGRRRPDDGDALARSAARARRRSAIAVRLALRRLPVGQADRQLDEPPERRRAEPLAHARARRRRTPSRRRSPRRRIAGWSGW